MDLREEISALDDTISALGTTIGTAQKLYGVVLQPEEPNFSDADADYALILGEGFNINGLHINSTTVKSAPSLDNRSAPGLDGGCENPVRGGKIARSNGAHSASGSELESDLVSGTHVRSGMLWKKGRGSRKPFGRKNWKCRYFVLGPGDGKDATRPRLRYLASESGRKVLGEVQLTQSTLQANVSHKKYEHYFQLKEADAGRCWHFYASSAEERDAWLKAISGAIKQLNAVSDAARISDSGTDGEANN